MLGRRPPDLTRSGAQGLEDVDERPLDRLSSREAWRESVGRTHTPPPYRRCERDYPHPHAEGASEPYRGPSTWLCLRRPRFLQGRLLRSCAGGGIVENFGVPHQSL